MKRYLLSMVLLMAGAAHAQGIIEYGQECADKVAPIPAFSCETGVAVPITVDGRTPDKYTKNMLCDRPSLLPPDKGQKTDGQCVPYSRALVLRDDDQAQISAFCRQKMIRPADTHLYDEVDIVAHNVRTGSTCWFQASTRKPLKQNEGVDGRKVPPPNQAQPLPGYPPAQTFWNKPSLTAAKNCVQCHDSGPFMYSPFIAQTRMVPGDPFGLYKNDIGKDFQRWAVPFSISTRGNACTTCHRIGNMNSCNVAMWQSIGQGHTEGLDAWGKKFPQSHWMPPGNLHSEAQWNEQFVRSVRILAACCQDPKGAECLTGGYTQSGKP